MPDTFDAAPVRDLWAEVIPQHGAADWMGPAATSDLNEADWRGLRHQVGLADRNRVLGDGRSGRLVSLVAGLPPPPPAPTTPPRCSAGC